MQQDLSEIIEMILEDDIHSYKFLMGYVWITLVVHDYSEKVSSFSNDIGQLDLTIIDADNTLRTENDDEFITRINQALSKPDEDASLTHTFQVRYDVTIINTERIKFNHISQIGIVIPNEDANYTVVKIMLRDIDACVQIRTLSYEDLKTISV